jgi:hypothetical protein
LGRSSGSEVEFDAQALLDVVERERCGFATAYPFDTSKEFRVTCIGRRRVLPNDGQPLDERPPLFRCELGRGREQLLDTGAELDDHDENVALGDGRRHRGSSGMSLYAAPRARFACFFLAGSAERSSRAPRSKVTVFFAVAFVEVDAFGVDSSFLLRT